MTQGFESFLTKAILEMLPSESVKLANGLEKGGAFQVGWRGLA